MPEVPEVTILTQYLITKLKGRIIKKMDVLSGKKPIQGINLLNGSKKYKVTKMESKGKLMWMTLSEIDAHEKKIYLISHLGLSGEWGFTKQDDDRIRITIYNDGNDKTYNLCYNDPRNFGNIEIVDSIDKLETKTNKLAPDALKTEFTDTKFIEMVNKFLNKSKKRKDQLIFKVLMTQTANEGIVSGLGNYLTPEILYRAKISPFRTIGSLNNVDLKNISESIKYLVKLSYYNNNTGYMTNFGTFAKIHKQRVDEGKYHNYQSDVKLKKNEEFKFNVYRQTQDPYGHKVEKDKTINKGRTVYWVPNVQV
jgi:formamidopyrimidine-DNA glycosylase